jgi:hypothetical protein
MYAPPAGRFTQPDPLRFNRPFKSYLYARNKPLSLIDPLGRRHAHLVVLESGPRENLFTPRRLNVVLADERFKEFRDRHGITNCPLIPAEQARWPWRKGAADP